MLGKCAFVFTVVAGLTLSGCYFCPFVNSNISGQYGFSFENPDRIAKNREMRIGSYEFGQPTDISNHFFRLSADLDWQDNRAKAYTFNIRCTLTRTDESVEEGRAQVRVPKTGLLQEARIEPFFEMANRGDRLDVYATVNKRIPAEIKWRIFLGVVDSGLPIEG